MTVERIVPDDLDPADPMLAEHVERYEMAATLIEADDVVVDAACGTGYGTHLLAARCRRAIGLDVDEAAIAYARSRYARANVDFEVSDLERDALPPCDVVVTFETIEHLRAPRPFIDAARAAARRLVVLSVPLGVTTTFNPYHLHDFERADVEEMLAPWAPAWFCYQSGSSREVIYGCWAFCGHALTAEQRLELMRSSRDAQQRQFELHHQHVRSQTRQLLELQESGRKLEESKQWLGSQVESWRAEAARLQAMVDELNAAASAREEGHAWLEAQHREWQAEAARLRVIIDELKAWEEEREKGHAWLDAQYHALQAETERLRGMLGK